MIRLAGPARARYAIGPFELDAARLVLNLGGAPLAAGPRVVATLAALVERAGEVVTKDEILDRVWAGEDVGESNVTQSVYTLRKMLREHGVIDAIATVARRGYRFTAPVELLPECTLQQPPPRPAAAAAPRSAGRRLASALAIAVVLFTAGGPAARAVSHSLPLSAHGAELYHLGRYYWNLRTPAGLAQSSRLFAAVVAGDPRSPLGYAGLADAEMMTADYQHDRVKPKPYFARARAEIRRALALDPDSAVAHASLAMLRSVADRDPHGAEAEFRRAIALDPAYAVAHHWYGITLFNQGRLADALRELRAAMALEPVSPATGAWLAEASYYGGRYADAIVYARRALDLDPHRGDALCRLGLAYELSGDLAHAIGVFERLPRSGPDAGEAAAALAEAYARAGRSADARGALRRAVRLHAPGGSIGLALLALGERKRGLALLAKMIAAEPAPALTDPRIESFRAALHLVRRRAAATT